jgi:hypothetical protein
VRVIEAERARAYRRRTTVGFLSMLLDAGVDYTYPAVKIFMPAGATKPIYAYYEEHVPPDVRAQKL